MICPNLQPWHQDPTRRGLGTGPRHSSRPSQKETASSWLLILHIRDVHAEETIIAQDCPIGHEGQAQRSGRKHLSIQRWTEQVGRVVAWPKQKTGRHTHRSPKTYIAAKLPPRPQVGQADGSILSLNLRLSKPSPHHLSDCFIVSL